MSEIDQRHNDYHIAEYSSLRQEILAQQLARTRLEQLGVAGVVGIYAWLATHFPEGAWRILYLLAWWLPVAVAYYCRRRQKDITKGIRHAGNYLIAIQAIYAHPELGGWEKQLRKMRESTAPGDREKFDLISRLSNKLWKHCVKGTLFIAIGASVLILIEAFIKWSPS